MATGLDAIGVAASIIQLADFGAPLSIKLYTFYHQVKNADERLNSLSSNVSLTCNVLKQLAQNLEQDDQARLYSHEAFVTAKQVSVDCDAIFKKIDGALDRFKHGLARSSLQRAAAKVGFVFMENDIHALRSDLERLKTTMLLLLNVVMYSGQIRSQAESKVIQEQSELIQTLVAEKRAIDSQFLALTGVFKNPADKLVDYTNNGAGWISNELRSYCSLVERILCEIRVVQSSLAPDQSHRVRNGILRLHSDEIVHCEAKYGPDVGLFLRNGLSAFRHNCDDVNVYMPPVTQTSRPQAKHVFSSSPETFMTSLETEVSMDEDRGSRKKGKAKGNAVLISHSDPNRPDIAAFERDYPFDAVFEAPIHSPCRPNIADSSIPRDPNHEDQRNCLSLFLEAPGEREEQFVRSVIDFTIDPVDKRSYKNSDLDESLSIPRLKRPLHEFEGGDGPSSKKCKHSAEAYAPEESQKGDSSIIESFVLAWTILEKQELCMPCMTD